MLAGFQSGAVDIRPGLLLAPMAGVTDSSFRQLVRECNPGTLGLVVSEFISIEGLTRADLRSHAMLRHVATERPLSIQIFGGDIDRMAEAAALVQAVGADVVDINCGCPVPKVVRRGGGAELMRTPQHLERLLRAVRRELSVPLTLKIRTGWDDESVNCVEIAEMAEAVGVAMITVHGRTRMQAYHGQADWERVGQVKRAVSIPVVGSGDVLSIEGAEARLATSGADGIAIGRGALGDPWIFSRLARAWGIEQSFDTSLDRVPLDRLALLERYRDLLAEMHPERTVAARLRMLSTSLFRGFPGAALLRQQLGATRGSEELLVLLRATSNAAVRVPEAA